MTAAFTDKVAFITGAGSGIGRAVALAFADAGADIAVTGLGDESLRETAELIEERGRRAHVMHCDVASEDDVAAAVASTVQHLGRLDFAVNNAGIGGKAAPSGELEPSAADRAVTARLKQALALLDLRLLDHVIVGGRNSLSMAARGWV